MTKNLLDQYLDLKEEINYLQNKAQSLCKNTDQYSRLHSLISKMTDRALDLECEVYLYIQEIPDPLMKQAFIYRYLEGLSWGTIGKKLFMHRTSISSKVDKYIKMKGGSNAYKTHHL